MKSLNLYPGCPLSLLDMTYEEIVRHTGDINVILDIHEKRHCVIKPYYHRITENRRITVDTRFTCTPCGIDMGLRDPFRRVKVLKFNGALLNRELNGVNDFEVINFYHTRHCIGDLYREFRTTAVQDVRCDTCGLSHFIFKAKEKDQKND